MQRQNGGPRTEPEAETGQPADDARSEPDDEPPQSDPNWKRVWAEVMAELNARFFVASLGGTVRIASLVRDDALGRDRLVFFSEPDIRLKYAHRHYKVGVSPNGRDISWEPAKAWLSDHRRRTYDRIALIPDGPCPPDVYNLWRGFGVEPKAGPWPTIEAHLLVGRSAPATSEHYDWLIGWLAYCVQHPGKQAEVAVVLRGLKGTGKGMVGQMLMRIFRSHSLHITNSQAPGRQLQRPPGRRAVPVPRRGILGRRQAGRRHAQGADHRAHAHDRAQGRRQLPDAQPAQDPDGVSNNDWVVPASADERRYFVLDVSGLAEGRRGLLHGSWRPRSTATSWRPSSTTCCKLDLVGVRSPQPAAHRRAEQAEADRRRQPAEVLAGLPDHRQHRQCRDRRRLA